MVLGLVWMFIKKKQHRVWRYPVQSALCSSEIDGQHTFYAVDLDSLAYVHDLDKGPFFRRDRLVHVLLIPNPAPVICHCGVGIPSLVLAGSQPVITQSWNV